MTRLDAPCNLNIHQNAQKRALAPLFTRFLTFPIDDTFSFDAR